MKLLILIGSSNIFHWKPAKENQCKYGLGAKFGQIKSNVVKKVNEQALSISTTGFQLKLLLLIESPNICHWKPAKENQSKCGLGANFGSNLV